MFWGRVCTARPHCFHEAKGSKPWILISSKHRIPGACINGSLRCIVKAALLVFCLVFICHRQRIDCKSGAFVGSCPGAFSEVASQCSAQKRLVARNSCTETSQASWSWIEASPHAWGRRALVLLYLCTT